MTTIMDLCARSLEYHGDLVDQGVEVGDAYYFMLKSAVNNGVYMCAIGCSLKDPEKFQSIVDLLDLSALHLYKKELGDIQDPLVKELLCFPNFREEALKLQILHDTTAPISLKKYLEDLKKFIELNYDFKALGDWREKGRL